MFKNINLYIHSLMTKRIPNVTKYENVPLNAWLNAD